ncbi:MAG: glucose-1-phosphate thymidylyltransferase, partial [Rhodothermales bacterium]|nr:glucose-1-phosphate thymidylyltransferase [Rhodothermales bacterium]
MNICVFEDDKVHQLAPILLTRPVFDLRTGRRTQGQELSRVLGASTTYAHCRKYLQDWTAAEYNIVV